MENVSRYIIDYIKNRRDYVENSIVVEVGIGYYLNVAKILRSYGVNVIGVDIKRDVIERAKREGLNAQLDDISNPKLKIYRDVDLLYSIRPPWDLQYYLLKISKRYRVPLLIRPLSNESVVDGLKLINYRGEVLYLYNDK